MARPAASPTTRLRLENLEARDVPAFVAAPSFPVGPEAGDGSEPVAVAVGDFNRDGKLDAVTANKNVDGISILLGKGNGGFKAPLNLLVGDAPSAVLAVDLNGDGKLDLVTTNEAGDSVSVLLGLGTGKFKAAATFPAGSSPVAVASGDVNGDNFRDLAVANGDSNTVTLLLGNGQGSFTTGTAVVVGDSPTSVVLRDFNGDNAPDLASVSGGFGHLDVNLNQGNGTFAAKVNYETGFVADTVVVGFFNGDSQPDLAVAHDFPSGDGVSILLGNADGTFQDFTAVETGNQTPAAMAVGDLDGDGHHDLITANDQFGNNSVTVLLGVGDGTFEPARVYNAGQGPVGVAIGDFNGDGLPDAVTADRGSTFTIPGAIGTLSFLAGNGNGTLSAAPNLVVDHPGPIVAADFTGDGRDDLAVITGVFTPGVRIYPSTGFGIFGAGIQSPEIAGAGSLAAGDFNGDGKNDLAVTYSTGVAILLGNGDGTFGLPTTFPAGSSVAWVAADDLNGDGKIDLAVANGSGASVLTGNGDGTFGTASPVAAGGAGTYLTTAEMNGDGRKDLIVVNDGATDTVSVVFGAAGGGFLAPTSYPTLVGPGSVGVGDFTGDSKPDLAVPTFFGVGGSSALTILRNGAQGAFAETAQYETDSRPIGNAIADFNGDGKLDIAVANNFGDTLTLYRGNGNGTFAAPIRYVVGDRPSWVTRGDFNGDGRPDLAVVNGNAGSVTLLMTPAPAVALSVRTAVATTVAGKSLVVTVVAVDGAGNRVTDFAGKVKLTSTDGEALLPAPYQFTAADQGTKRFTVTLKTAGAQDVVAKFGTLTGTVSLLVEAAAAKKLTVDAPANPVAGVPFDLTLTARDAYGNVAPTYAGTVRIGISGSPLGVTLPADYTFTPADAGVHVFADGVTVEIAGARKITATTVGSSVKGKKPVTVVAGAVSKFLITGLPLSVAKDAVRPFTVIATDAFGNRVTNYDGTVRFTTVGGTALLPADYAFTARDKGKHRFKVTFQTLGADQSLTAEDLADPAIIGSVTGITVV